ncbi:hypothetical protein Q9L42_016320 [Methylomarinum sp. Ch1-1]|uniref:Lipoprotein n=1 Tax=Methylomarinum roseum TaxID=3067653 RepID=A0AAU7NSJ2_9GAMM|nr:hypothetical protein [Methylomarinum sp. Ch1-1]MDP4520102.1 hypothetical protein [Methylomarinum sp. Ch1-1]
MTQIISRLLFFSLAAMMLTACAGSGARISEQAQETTKVMTASGQGRFIEDASLTREQTRLAAEQAAKMDAYRELASLLYREDLGDGGTVGAQVMRDESYRVYFDTYLREAKVLSSQTLGKVVHVDLTLALTERFYHCMAGETRRVRQCLLQDDKIPFTRIGYRSAEIKTVNLGCGSVDCSGLLHVNGFADGKNAFDRGLLNAGLYDSEWTLNTAGRLFINYIFLNSIPK